MKKTKKLAIIIICIVLVLGLAIGGICLFLFTPLFKSPKQQLVYAATKTFYEEPSALYGSDGLLILSLLADGKFNYSTEFALDKIKLDSDAFGISAAIEEMKLSDVDIIICTGGMSVDPDDNTPGAIKKSGAEIITYGAPVLPGAMFLLGYFDDMPIMGLPGCVMYAKATIFDMVLPRVAAGVKMTKKDFVEMGEGGLCLGCDNCHFPNCGYGK